MHICDDFVPSAAGERQSVLSIPTKTVNRTYDNYNEHGQHKRIIFYTKNDKSIVAISMCIAQ